ncbi:MAG: glycosyltransferase family 2 protein [Burkholderiales bacterium]|nr:glycosyltransferase family 2 protein [Burkholderiales bacterium]
MSGANDRAAPSIAVIIVNFNAGAMLERCLAALDRQTYRDFRVIVVDNASTDGSVDGIAARHPGVVLVPAGVNLGFAAGNNLGLRHAGDADWILLLNPDAYAAPDCLERLVAAAAAGGFDFFGCRMRLADIPELLDGTGDVYHTSGVAWRRDHGLRADAGAQEPGEIFAPCAAAALYRCADLEAVGGFDESYFCYFEDIDLAFRLRLRGLRCGYVPDAVVDHVSSGITGKRSDFATYHGHRNMVWTYVKDMPAALFWLYLPLHLCANLLAIAACAARGQFRVVLRAKRDALLGLPRVLRERARVQAGARAGWRAIRAAMARGLPALWSRS